MRQTGSGAAVVPGLRAGLAGGTCATGAMTAHVAAGGQVTPLAGLLALAVSLVLAPRLLGRVVDPVRTLALSLVVQVVWHAVFTVTGGEMSPGGNGGHGGHGAMTGMTHMAVLHLVAAAVAAALAVGAERLVVDVGHWLAGVLLPVLAVVVAVPSPVSRERHRDEPTATPHDRAYDAARPRRGPPRVLALG